MDDKILQKKILEIEDNLKDAQTTIKLQQKQARDYEKIIQKLKEKIRVQRDFICTHIGEEMVKELDCPLTVIPTLTQPPPLPSLDKNTRRKYRTLPIINKKDKNNDSKTSSDNLIQLTLHSLSKINSKKGSSRWETITSPNTAIDYDQHLFNNINHTNHHVNDRDNHHNHNKNQQNNTSNHNISDRDSDNHNDGHRESTTPTVYSPQQQQQQHDDEPFLDFLKKHSSKSLLTSEITLNNNDHSNQNSLISSHSQSHSHHQQVHHKRKNNKADHIWSTVPSPTSTSPNRLPNTELLSTTNDKENTVIISDYSPSMRLSSPSHLNSNSNKKNVYVQDSMIHWDKKKKGKYNANSDKRLPLMEHNKNKKTVAYLKKSNNSDKSILSDKKTENKSYDSYVDALQEKQERENVHDSTCTCCANYFENDSTSSANIKGSIDIFSKHKLVYERPKTPPGFWDLTFPASPEKRQQ